MCISVLEVYWEGRQGGGDGEREDEETRNKNSWFYLWNDQSISKKLKRYFKFLCPFRKQFWISLDTNELLISLMTKKNFAFVLYNARISLISFYSEVTRDQGFSSGNLQRGLEGCPVCLSFIVTTTTFAHFIGIPN